MQMHACFNTCKNNNMYNIMNTKCWNQRDDPPLLLPLLVSISSETRLVAEGTMMKICCEQNMQESRDAAISKLAVMHALLSPPAETILISQQAVHRISAFCC
mmetsp:Transcript_37845/g.58884  ORF Transcript_37845/g.58884 Transcript_37845/m.58884 type:complete len:102 (-) Transcript_37845:370-675(-)